MSAPVPAGASEGRPNGSEDWSFAGWGRASRITDLEVASGPIDRLDQPHKRSLGSWSATAICGNDITSSCLALYAAGNMLLKTRRSSLPRETRADWPGVLIAFA